MITKSKNLRTGRTVWQGRRGSRVDCRPLTRDEEAEVLVVGAGITGAMIAEELIADGHDVLVVDRRGPANGATAASTALVQYELDTPLTVLTRKIGKERAARAWRRSRLAVDAIAGTLTRLEVPDVQRRDTLYLAGNVLDPDGLRREAIARRAAGLDTTLLSRADMRETFGMRAAAALLTHGNLTIDPRKVTTALLAHAISQGAKVRAPVNVTDLDARERSVTAQAESGHRIRARHVVLASGYEFPKSVPLRGHKIISTWVIATRPQRQRLWPGEAMFWESADPYLYVRTTAEGRVICGGEDEPFSDAERRDALLPHKIATLQRKLAQRIPGLDTRVEFAWAGAFGQTATGLPSIGKIPDMPNCWAALGYGGNGTTYARIAADVIRNALAGHPDSDADLYDFPRPAV